MKINIFYRKKLTEHHSIEKVYDTLIPYFEQFNITKIELPHPSKGILLRILNIFFANKHQGNVNHISGDVNYINLLMAKSKTILTIHDIFPLYRATGLKRFLFKLIWFDFPIKKSKKIITVSEFTKIEIIKHFNISPEKIKVIYNCISSQFKPNIKEFNRKEPSILHLGTKENKNLNRLIEAINGLTLKLLIIGKLNTEQLQKLLEHNVNYENFQNVSDTQLVQLYQKADIVSFISTYEGFGLPIIEAQAIGRVVITSNVASMPEVAGDGALLVNPFSVEEIRDGILKLIDKEKLRDDLVRKGFENVKRFEPQKIANQYIDVYQNIIDAQQI